MSGVRRTGFWLRRVPLAIVSTLMVLTGIVWLSSMVYLVSAAVPLSSHSSVELWVGRGTLRLSYYSSTRHPSSFDVTGISYFDEARDEWVYPPIEWWRFDWQTFPNSGILSGTFLSVPMWVLFAVLLIWPASEFVNWFKRQRPAHTLCVGCGYDLRGSGGSKTCPECGAKIP